MTSLTKKNLEIKADSNNKFVNNICWFHNFILKKRENLLCYYHDIYYEL
jgi:hypothetical protein